MTFCKLHFHFVCQWLGYFLVLSTLILRNFNKVHFLYCSKKNFIGLIFLVFLLSSDFFEERKRYGSSLSCDIGVPTFYRYKIRLQYSVVLFFLSFFLLFFSFFLSSIFHLFSFFPSTVCRSHFLSMFLLSFISFTVSMVW